MLCKISYPYYFTQHNMMNNTNNIQLLLKTERQRQQEEFDSETFLNSLLQKSHNEGESDSNDVCSDLDDDADDGDDDHSHPYITEHDTHTTIYQKVCIAINTYASHVYTSENEKQKICKQLQAYRWVNTLDQLTIGSYAKVIRIVPNHHHTSTESKSKTNKNNNNNNNTITIFGGFISTIRFLSNGTYIHITTYPKKCFLCKYDNFLWFVKLTEQDHLRLYAQETLGSLGTGTSTST